MATNMNQDHEYLFRMIDEHFNLKELHNLYFLLRIDHEQAESTKHPQVRFLIEECERQGRLQDLINRCLTERPDGEWANLMLPMEYGDEIKTLFVTFWNEYVTSGGSNSQFLAQRRPVEGVYSYAPLEDKRPESGSKHEEQKEDDATREEDKREGGSEKPPDEPSSYQLTYAAIRSRLEMDTLLLLIAEPGAGKTLWLRYLADQSAANIAEPDAAIPIYLPLNAYRGEEDLTLFISSVLRANEQLPFHRQLADRLNQVIKRRPLLLLMDGLNEISESAAVRESQKGRFTRALQAFVGKHNVKCLVASRETEFVASLDWPQIKIHPLDRTEVIRCLDTYAPEATADIYRLLDEKHLFGTLTSNAYRVRALCQIYKPSSGLPENLGELYEAFVATLVDREEARRRAQGEQWQPFDSWASRVSELARLLTDAEATAIETSRLEPQLHDAKVWACAEGAGLLSLRNGRLQFSHQQLQEFFAAHWLKTGLETHGLEWDGFSVAIRKRAWDQPLLLLAGIAAPALLDSLIAPIAAVDPILAGRCVGGDPARVSAATRQWLATYLTKALSFAVNNVDRDLTREIVRAAGEMRCDDGLSVLTQPETATHARRWAESDYYRAVARANSPAAATVLIAAIEEEATTPKGEWRQAIRESARALASMRVPRAQRFLARSLVDSRIYQDVLPVVGEVDTGIGYAELRTLLAHDSFWRLDDESVFADLAAAAARVAPRALLPDLLRHVDKPAAVEALLRLGAGQQIIDDYVRRHSHTKRRQAWEADARAFGIQHVSFQSLGGGASELIDLRNYLYHNAGERAAGDFVDLLLAVTTRAGHNRQEPLAAVQVLTTMRQSRVLPRLRALRAAEFPESVDRWSSYNSPVRNGDELQRLVNDAIAFLEEPRGIGVIHHPLDRFALALRGVRAEPDGQALPASASELLDWAHREPKRFERFAAQTLEGLVERIRRTDWGVGYEYGALLRSAAGHLAERGWPELADTLVRMLVTAAESESDYREEWIAATGDQLIAHGRRGPEPKRSIAERVAPLVHRPNRELQLAAVRVLALIDAGEYCAEWLEYLSDRTWPLAYVIVDALGCMTVPATFHSLLAAQLQSFYDGERYFAVLALGSIGRAADLPRVLALDADSSVEVRRAVLWAVSQLGASDPGVVDVLADGLASPHARLRREAANTIGELRLQALNCELRPLLEDSDLRVVERAAWALGRLDDRDSVTPLMSALAGAIYQDDWESRPGLHHRVDYRLRETIVTSLAQIQVGVDKDAIARRLDREKGLFPAIVAGRLDERAWGRFDRRSAEYAREPDEGRASAGQPALDAVSPEELKTIARRAADPQQRKRALGRLGEEIRDYESLFETIRGRDPHPEVQLEILRIAVGLGPDHRLGHTITGNPEYDLKLAREIGDAGPEIALRIPLPEAWNAPAALWLAQRFPDAYNLQPLIAGLSESLEAPCEPDYRQMRTLGSLLERRPLARYSLEGKVSWYPWDTITGLPRGDTSWSPSIPYLLAQRRVWGIVPRLLEGLSQEKRGSVNGWPHNPKHWNLTVIEALCELGVYQAGDLIQETLTQLQPDKDVEVSVAQVMARVELSGHFGEKLPERFRDEQFLASALGYGAGKQFLYFLSNILAGSDSERDFEEGLKLEAELSGGSDVGNHADSSWLDRRLRRWGQHHLRRLIRILSVAGHHDVIEDIGDSLMLYERHHYISWRAKEIARAVQRCPAAMLASWLEDDSWAVRWVGFCGLAATGSARLEEHALRLLQEGNPQIIVGLLRRADKHPLPALFRFLGGESELGLGGGHEELACRLHQIVDGHLAAADQSVKRAIIAILGKHRTRRFAPALTRVALNDEPETAVAALEALREIGDRSQAATLRPLLDVPHLDILEAAIQTMAVLRYRPASGRLLELLQHPEGNIQFAATGACALMQIRKAVPLLQQRLAVLKAPSPPPPDPDSAADDEGGDRGVTVFGSTGDYELLKGAAAEMTEFALFLLHATPRLSVAGMEFNAGDGLLALCAFYWYYLPTSLLTGWRLRMTDRGLPYPLGLLPTADSRLIAHAMRRDLRAATWASRSLRELLPESTALFVARPPEERAEESGDIVPKAAPWPSTGEAAADTLVAAVLDALNPLEQRLREGWNAVRGQWAADVAPLDLDALDTLDDFPSPDVYWTVLKAVVIDTFDRLLPGERGLSPLPSLPIGGIYDGYAALEDLGLSDHNSILGSLIRAARYPDDARVELDDDLWPLLAVIDEGELQRLIACQGLARLYFTCALLAGWGYSVLRRLQEQFSNPALGAGYVDRVASYLWPLGRGAHRLAIVPDDRKVPGEKVNPLAAMDE